MIIDRPEFFSRYTYEKVTLGNFVNGMSVIIFCTVDKGRTGKIFQSSPGKSSHFVILDDEWSGGHDCDSEAPEKRGWWNHMSYGGCDYETFTFKKIRKESGFGKFLQRHGL